MQDKLTEMSELGSTLGQLVQKRAEIQANLDDVDAEIEKIQGETLPTMMLDLNMQEFTLSSGQKIKFMTIYKATIPDEFKNQAFEWLKNSGNDAIIKNLVKVQFGMSENQVAEECVKYMRERGIMVEQDINVHPRTLESFVKEKLTSGDIGFPQEIFGVKTFNRVTVK